MRIEIVRLADVDNGTVEFRCDVGTAIGYWEGPPPSAGETVDVEIDVPDDVTEWTVRDGVTAGVLETVPETAAADQDGMPVRVAGTVEEIGDPVVVLRVGSGLVLVEFTGSGPELSVGSVVEFVVPHIRLFPTDL